jgi:hypothetical protein
MMSRVRGQALFAVVEQLIDEVFPGLDAAQQDKLEEDVGELMLLVQEKDHLLAGELEHFARGDGGGGGVVNFGFAGQQLLSDEVAGNEKGNGGFFASAGDDGQLGAAGIEKEDRIGVGALREEHMTGLHLDQTMRNARGGKEAGRIEQSSASVRH